MLAQGNGTERAYKPHKRRVLFVITQSEMGGAQQFLTQLVRHADASQFQWTVVVGSEGAHELKKNLPDHAAYIVAKNLKRNPNILSDILSLVELRYIYKAVKPDVIFLNSSKAGFNGSLAALWLPIRVIYRIGGWAFNDPRPRWQKFSYRLLEKISARWKDEIIVNSQKDFDDAQRFGIKPRKGLHLIHNGIDPYQSFLSKDVARLQLENHVGHPAAFRAKYWVGTIAHLYPTKGLFDLLSVVERVPDATFVVIGDGELRLKLESEIKNRGLEQRIFLVGKIEHASQLLPAFDAFILPSLKEGFPWVLLEAAAAKVPIIATRVGAVPEFIEDGISGMLVPPRAPEALARALTRVLRDDQLRSQLPINAHQRLLKRFSLHDMIERYQYLLS